MRPDLKGIQDWTDRALGERLARADLLERLCRALSFRQGRLLGWEANELDPVGLPTVSAVSLLALEVWKAKQ